MILPPVGTPPTPFTGTPEEGSISPALNLGPKEINPNARELLAAQNVVADPFASYQDAPTPASFDQFQNAPAQDEFAAFKSADDLDIKSSDELNADRTNFNPVSYFQSNPDAAKDPAKLKKLLDIYRKRREEGLSAGEVTKAAIKETPGLVANIAGGVKRLGERAIDLTVQPVANVLGSVITGDFFDTKKREAFFDEAKKNIKKGAAEVSAGSESASVGLVDLSRQGLRKIETEQHKPKSPGLFPERPLKPGEFPGLYPEKPVKPLTDQELLRDISDDVAFRQNAAEILTGQGEAAKKIGLDKETLAKQGITLDEKAIEQLSLVDPITMVATGGAFKLIGVGGKILGTARTLEGIQYASGKLADLAKMGVGKGIQYSGTATKAVGKALQGTGGAAALITGVGSAVRGAGTIESLALAGAAKLAGPTVRKVGALAEHFGKSITGEVATSATAQKIIDYAKIAGRPVAEVGKGALTGIAAAAPFAVMADEDATAGALFGAGTALGAGHAAGAGALRVVKNAAAREYFGPNRPVLEDVASPAYGKEAALDATHEANISKLSAQDASELNNFREVLRQQGGEIYALDRPTWRKEMERIFPDATPEQLDIYEGHSAFFDEAKGPDRRVVYLNTDTKGLQHDAGHIFDAILSPEKRTELREAVTGAFPEKAFADFQATYERRVGNKISKKAALDEFIAEQFAALFNNVPVTELNAPKSLLKKFVDTVAEGAESLGIDLSAGAGTPQFNAPVSVGIRKIFQNAAGDVVRANIEGVPPTNVTPLPPTPPPAPAGTSPVAPPTNIVPLTTPPSNVVPLTPPRNIRVTPEQVAAFKQSASPEIRALADARARETGVDYARTEAKKAEGSPTSQIIERISDSMESGAPVVGIEHLGITSESTPSAPAGRTARRGEQAAGYAALDPTKSRSEAPADVVATHSKNFVPVRWTDQGGTPTLIAMSLDKVLANIERISKAASNPEVSKLIPYPVENGKLTEAGWREVVADAQSYSENQANGRKGDGSRLDVPEADLSVPAENPSYTPKILSPERADFQNLIQGLNIPDTARPTKGKTPRNIKGQIFAKANLRPVELPSVIPKKNAGKQAFLEFPPSVIMEVNPLRNKLRKVDYSLVKDLTEVTERVRAKDIVSATPRPEINYKAPVTDVITGGFLPGPERVNEVKSALAESIKTGPLDFNTFMSAFRDNYFSGWEDHPSFSEMTKRFPNSDLLKSYEGLREEFNQYFKYDNDQVAAKFNEAAGDPVKEAQAAEYATRQWESTDEHLNSRLYELLQSEGRLISPPTSGPYAKTGITQKSLEAVDWSEIRRTLQEMDPKDVQFNFGSDIHRVEDLIEGLILNPEKSPNSIPKQDQPAFQRLLNQGREQLSERGTSSGLFLPAPTEFRHKNLQGRTVEEFSDSILKATPEQWKAVTDSMTGGLTGGAWNLGLGLTDRADVAILKSYAAKFSDAAKAAMTAGDFDSAFSQVTRGQFFREAYEAATGTGSAGAAFKKGTSGMASAKPPFPIAEKTQRTATGAGDTTTVNVGESGQFQPAKERALTTEEQVDLTYNLEARYGLTENGAAFVVQELMKKHGQSKLNEMVEARGSAYRYFHGVEGDERAKSILSVLEREGTKPSDLRNLLAGEIPPDRTVEQLKESGDPQLLSVAQVRDINRRLPSKLHGKLRRLRNFAEEGAILVIDYDKIPSTTIKQAQKYLNPLGFDLVDDSIRGYGRIEKIGPSGPNKFDFGQTRGPNPFLGENPYGLDYGGFQPAEQLEVGTAEQPPDLRVLRTPAAAGGTPPIEPPSGAVIPPPVAAGFQPAEELQPDQTPELKIVAAGGTPPIEPPTGTVIPPPMGAANFQPRTESGRKLEEKGFEIVPSGEMGIRRVAIEKDGNEVAIIQSVQRSPTRAEISMVQKFKGAPKGIGEVLYREVGAQLKEDGVKLLEGQVISPEPLAIRKKIFGGFKSININEEPATYAQALAETEQPATGARYISAVEPVNEITADTAFLPGKRDKQGRPLDKEGDIDYAKWQAEGIAAVKKQRAEPIESVEPTGPVTKDSGNATGWILPDKKFVSLEAAFHEQYLANNADALNKKFGTDFSDTASTDDRITALNAGFVRFRNQGGRLSVEANSAKWPALKSKVLETLQDREGKFDSLSLSLLNDKGQQVDSTSALRLHEMTGPEKLNAIEEAVDSVRGGRFAPGPGLPGFEEVSVEQAGRLKAKRRIASVKKNNPEAISPQYARDESGEIIVSADGNPKPLTLDYDFINSPVAKEAAKGLKGAAREEAAAEAIGNKLVDFYKEAEKNPDLKAGSKWYSTARTRLRGVFGDDSKFFAELLGATSARTPVATNYRFALDAYNQFKAGAYDKTLAKYREGKAAWESGDVGDFKGETRGQFMDFWVRKHDLGVTQSNGKKFGMNSRAVLRVLDGSWASEVVGPKTPNFAGNLTGESFRATIDVWSGRTLNRLANEGKKDRWRILPENEVGINDRDFYFGQAAYESAAKKLGIRADSLQAVLWFAEKQKWEQNGWTRGAGAELSDFNVLLKETEKTPTGMKMKTPQIELGLDTGAEISTLKKK